LSCLGDDGSGRATLGATARPISPLQRNEEYRPETDPLASDGFYFQFVGNGVERSQRGTPGIKDYRQRTADYRRMKNEK